jgi:hypothetical protein
LPAGIFASPHARTTDANQRTSTPKPALIERKQVIGLTTALTGVTKPVTKPGVTKTAKASDRIN